MSKTKIKCLKAYVSLAFNLDFAVDIWFKICIFIAIVNHQVKNIFSFLVSRFLQIAERWNQISGEISCVHTYNTEFWICLL